MFDLVIKNALIADGTGQTIYKGEIAIKDDKIAVVSESVNGDAENIMKHPDGIDYVIVNGKTVIDHGEHTGSLPGVILRKA